jgi:hypothetical protein
VLADWKNLEGLQGIYGRVSDSGLRNLGRLTNLKRLVLCGTKTSGAGIKHLTAIHRHR